MYNIFTLGAQEAEKLQNLSGQSIVRHPVCNEIQRQLDNDQPSLNSKNISYNL